MIASNEKTVEIMFSLLRSVICGDQLGDEQRADVTAEVLPELFALSNRHDIAHLIALGLQQNDLPSNADFENEMFKAIFRYEAINSQFELVCSALERAQIPFVPLKGAVIRKYYKEPWYRTSSDIDILVHEEDLDRAVDCLINTCGYRNARKEQYDISLFAENGIHVELHYDLVEKGNTNPSTNILKTMWLYTTKHENYNYWYDLSDDMFYLYHVVHMAKHFEQGGCGIRPFIDTWILNNIDSAKINERKDLLRQSCLLRFVEVCCELCSVWFDNHKHTDTTRQIQWYILTGGVYGTTENAVAIQQQKQGGKIRYWLSRIFMPYDVIKYYYPILQKHRWLTPIVQIGRCFKIVLRGRAERAKNEIKYSRKISDEQSKAMKKMLEDVGL